MSEHDSQLASIHVMFADDHAVVRMGLVAVFASDATIQVVGEISRGDQVLPQVQRLWPNVDVLILDARMPGFEPVATVQQLTSQYADIKILILSSYDDPEYVLGLLNAGARGYILKDEPRATLLSAIHIVADGDTYMSPKVARVYVDRQRALANDRDRLLALTERERDVLRCVGGGLDNREISDALMISYETVKSHLRNINSKLSLENRYQAIVFAIRNEIAQMD